MMATLFEMGVTTNSEQHAILNYVATICIVAPLQQSDKSDLRFAHGRVLRIYLRTLVSKHLGGKY